MMIGMTEKDVLNIFNEEKALLTGHFLLSSGLHSPNYMQCALLLQKPWVAEKLCRALAGMIRESIDVVIGPALGGVIVSYEMGRALKRRSIFAERVDGTLALRRGFMLEKNEKVLVVEDVVTTGRSTHEVIEIVREQGAQVAAIASLVDRSAGKHGFQVPFYALLPIEIKSYEALNCPLCREGGQPPVKPGSRTHGR